MRVIIFGATGMVGAGVLIECLDDPRVASVLAIGRSSTGITHAKLREIVRPDLFDYSDVRDSLRGFDACFFCLGVSAFRMEEDAYTRITHDLTIAAATVLAELNPGMTFCYVSGAGTDSSERGLQMWARVKGRTENRLFAMPLRAFAFRPGFIVPMKGVRSKTPAYNAVYVAAAPLFPILRRLAGRLLTTTDAIGRAMIAVAAGADAPRVLGNREIDQLGAARQ